MERRRTLNSAKKRKSTNITALKFKPMQQYTGIMLLMIIGAAFGSVFVKNTGLSSSGFAGTGFFIQDILSKNAASKGFMSLAVSSFFPVALLLCVAFLLGLCVVGVPFELMVPIIHGAWLGTSMAYIDTKYGVKGLGICVLFILPQAIISALSVMVACREGVQFSFSVAMTIFRGLQKPLLANFRKYCFKYVVCFLFAVVASAIEAVSILVFAKIFFT